MKSGFIALLGKPNVGKSSLMNAIIGEKVSIVSPKPQTTRDKILGILTTKEYQMIFVDTPGIHEPKTKLGEYMDKAVKTAEREDADAIVIVLDAQKTVSEKEIEFIERNLKRGAAVYVAVNKVDLVPYERVYANLDKLKYLTAPSSGRAAIKEIVPLSCKTGKNVDVLKKFLESELKDEILYYPADEITDKSLRYMASEVIREKALLYLQDEIPHGIGVFIQNFITEKKLVTVEADIICEKDSHKSIIIGSGGEMLKTIGEKARIDLERLINKKVFLKLFVKIRKDWRDKKSVIDDITTQ